MSTYADNGYCSRTRTARGRYENDSLVTGLKIHLLTSAMQGEDVMFRRRRWALESQRLDEEEQTARRARVHWAQSLFTGHM